MERQNIAVSGNPGEGCEGERTGSVMERQPWVTPVSLIEAFGDSAWDKGMQMLTQMIGSTPDDHTSIEDLRLACMELMRRGYHKRHKEPA